MAIQIKGAPSGPKQVGKSNYTAHLAESVKAKQVMGSVTVGEAQTHVPVHKAMVDDGCKVGCSGGRTVNLGNYESVKINVWLEMPCSKATLSETFDFVSEWVGQQLEEATKLAKG